MGKLSSILVAVSDTWIPQLKETVRPTETMKISEANQGRWFYFGG